MSRDKIFADIRRAIGAKPNDAARIATVETRLAEHPRHMIPQRAQKPRDELRQQFAQYLTAQAATVIDVPTTADVPRTAVRVLRDLNLPPRLRMGADPWLAAMPWSDEPSLDIAIGRSSGDDAVTLSHAIAGVSETGTLALLSGADNPVTLSFLPDAHIIAVEADTIVGPYEDVFDMMRVKLGPTQMPRTLNFISGASRTADIGGKIVIGAHGPRRLVVLVVG